MGISHSRFCADGMINSTHTIAQVAPAIQSDIVQYGTDSIYITQMEHPAREMNNAVTYVGNFRVKSKFQPINLM